MKKLELYIVGVVTALVMSGLFLAWDERNKIKEINTKLTVTPSDVHALLRDEFQLRNTLSKLGYALVEADATGKITKWDDTAAAMWGYSANEILGKRVEALMSERVASDHAEVFKDGMYGGGSTARSAACEFAKHKEGWLFSIQLEIRVIDKTRVVALIQKINNG